MGQCCRVDRQRSLDGCAVEIRPANGHAEWNGELTYAVGVRGFIAYNRVPAGIVLPNEQTARPDLYDVPAQFRPAV